MFILPHIPGPPGVVSVTQGLINAFICYKLAGSMEQCHFGVSRLIKHRLPTFHCKAMPSPSGLFQQADSAGYCHLLPRQLINAK